MSNLEHRASQRGSTLVEMVTGLAAGMVVVLAALATFGGLQASAVANQDAAQLQQKLDVALHAIGYQLRQAGAIELRSLPGGRVGFSQAFDGYAGSGFAVSGDEGSAGRTDALRVSHEDGADARDCLGNRPNGAAASVRVDSRFTVVSGQLRCLGANAGTGSQLLVDGVEDFQVLYGRVSGNAAAARWSYVDANQIGLQWAEVKAVRVCLQLRGDRRHEAATLVARNLGCNGQPMPADERLHRVVMVTFQLRNASR